MKKERLKAGEVPHHLEDEPSVRADGVSNFEDELHASCHDGIRRAHVGDGCCWKMVPNDTDD